jgi:hypothetical protein
MPWFLPVQCLGQSSVRRSLNDQTETNGSWTKSGTAGGRWAVCCMAKVAARTASTGRLCSGSPLERASFISRMHSPGTCARLEPPMPVVVAVERLDVLDLRHVPLRVRCAGLNVEAQRALAEPERQRSEPLQIALRERL